MDILAQGKEFVIIRVENLTNTLKRMQSRGRHLVDNTPDDELTDKWIKYMHILSFARWDFYREYLACISK